MIDVFLPIFAAAVAGAAIAGSIRILQYYQREEDSRFGAGCLCKAIVVASLTLAFLLVVLLPLDVRNTRPGPGIPGLMAMLWRVAFSLLAAFAFVIVPGAAFYDEVEGDDTVQRKGRHVFCNLGFTVFISAAIIGISYPFLGDVALPVQKYTCDAWEAGDADVQVADICFASIVSEAKFKADLQVYLVAILCFFGWLFLAVFGGIGLTAVPLDLILSFVDRPRPIDEKTYTQQKQLLGRAAQAMLRQSEELQRLDGELAEEKSWGARWRRRTLNQEFSKFKRDIYLLEEEFDRLRVSKFERGENPAVSFAKLVLGIICALLSIAWLVHIVSYMVIAPGGRPAFLCLNLLLALFDHPGLYPVGVSIFAAISLYLLVCVVKGCLKFGMRFFFIFSIHPMRFKATPLSSILFNVEMVLIASPAVVQLTMQGFRDYARLTDADALFAAQVRYMKFFGLFYKYSVFLYLLLACALLALIYLSLRPRDRGEVGLAKKGADRLEAILKRDEGAAAGTAKSGEGKGSWSRWGTRKQPTDSETEATQSAGPPPASVIARGSADSIV
mmetsp:Transcript_47260/g.151692  ORF Transcript_47260/g.151692 Transcript_47260/m.151692 type:complete len:557 (-) Transcript_47260:49-1719(-)